MNYQEIREQICDVCHKMWQLGWVAANDGNVSVKLPDGNFLVTPTGISKSFITPEKLVIIDKDMNIVEAEGNYKPSSEIKCTCAAIPSATTWARWFTPTHRQLRAMRLRAKALTNTV